MSTESLRPSLCKSATPDGLQPSPSLTRLHPINQCLHRRRKFDLRNQNKECFLLAPITFKSCKQTKHYHHTFYACIMTNYRLLPINFEALLGLLPPVLLQPKISTVNLYRRRLQRGRVLPVHYYCVRLCGSAVLWCSS